MQSSPAPARRSSLRGPVSAVAATLAVVVSIVASEGAIVAIVAVLGPFPAFGVVFVVCSAASILVAFAFDAGEAIRGASPLVRKIRGWIDRTREGVARRAERLARLSEIAAFAVLSIWLGPLLTTIAVKLRGVSRQTGYALSLVSSAIFSAVWVAIYSGGLAVLERALAG